MRQISTTLLDHRDPQVAEKILLVQHAAYRQEAELLRVECFPPLDRKVTDILCSLDKFYGAWIKDTLVGVTSIEFDNDRGHASISSMTVDPHYQRLGVASALMSRLLKENESTPLTVSTGALNAPALALYVAFGFAVTKSWKLEGFDLELVELRNGSLC